MDDLISRKALIEKCQSWHGHGWQHSMCLEKDIRNAPSIDAEPVRHGRWEWYEDWGPSTWLEPPDCIAAEWRCSSCKTSLADYIEAHAPGETVYMDNSDNKPTLERCPCCGAKMDAKEE